MYVTIRTHAKEGRWDAHILSRSYTNNSHNRRSKSETVLCASMLGWRDYVIRRHMWSSMSAVGVCIHIHSVQTHKESINLAHQNVNTQIIPVQYSQTDTLQFVVVVM